MGTEQKFQLMVHHAGNVKVIKNVNPRGYNHMEMLYDACEVSISNVSAALGLTMKLYCLVPGTSDKMLLIGDEEIKDCFEMYKNSKKIDLYLEVGEGNVGSDNPLVSPDDQIYPPCSLVSSNPLFSPSPLVSSGREFGGGSGWDWQYSTPIGSNSNVFTEDGGVNYSDAEWDSEKENINLSDSDQEWMEIMNDDSIDVPFGVGDADISDYESDNSDQHLFISDESDSNHETDYLGKSIRGKVYEEVEGEKIVLEKGLMFDDINKFRAVLKDYTIQEGFKLVRDKNDKKKIRAHCGSLACSWRIHASVLPDGVTYMIKKIGTDHTCVRGRKNVEANSTWIAQKLRSRFRADPQIKLEVLHAEVLEKYGVDVSRMSLYRAKRKALEVNTGSHSESYGKLWKYGAEIRKTNPGSLAKVELYEINNLNPNPSFKRFFISFAANHIGFKDGCRPFIGLDGCHLKGPFGGVLLSAVALDGNYGLFPIAYAVVEAENKDSWSFFLYYLHTVVGYGVHNQPITFMTDGQKGIEPAMQEHFPFSAHRRCCRHIFNNFKCRFSGLKFRKSFWAAARSYTERGFREAMSIIEGISVEAHRWLLQHPVEMWARHKFDTGCKTDNVTNNMVESFNSWVGNERDKPLLTVVDSIRCKIMGKLQKRYQKAVEWQGKLTPKIKKKVGDAISQSRSCKLIFSGGDEFEVMELGQTYVVNMSAKSCCCRVWDITGVPCKHAAACISYQRMDIEELTNHVYWKDTYLKAYGKMIHPLHDESMWPDAMGAPIQAPPLRRLPGRPRKSRRREADESQVGTSEMKRSCTLRCSICKGMGHNKRTCQRAPVRASSIAATRGRGGRVVGVRGGVTGRNLFGSAFSGRGEGLGVRVAVSGRNLVGSASGASSARSERVGLKGGVTNNNLTKSTPGTSSGRNDDVIPTLGSRT